MERILTSKQMRDADSYTINNLGVSQEDLVYRAGSAVAEAICKKFAGGRVLVCIGKGNNGEDGKIVAEILALKHGFNVSVINVSNGIFKIFDKKFDIIIDCIFGTGLNRQVTGKYAEVIDKINNSGAYIVSCDIASGLNSDTGFPMGACVKANMTVCIQDYKIGHFLNEGIDYSGELVLKDIGISFWDDNCVKRFTSMDLQPFFPKINRNVHKGNFPKVAIIGGSKNFAGGVILSYNGLSALKMGCGYVNLAIPESLISLYSSACPECTITPLKDDNGQVCYEHDKLESLLNYDAIALGMGIGVSEDVYKIIRYLLKYYHGRLLLDADALNTISQYGVDVLKTKSCQVIITPHVGEFSRLIKENKEEIMPDIIEKARQFASDFEVVVAVKSATTVITDGREVYLNTTGCSGMAKGGSGDVLSGIVAGVLAKKHSTLESVVAGCYIFGRAGEIAQGKSNEYCLVASDVIKSLPEVINSL